MTAGIIMKNGWLLVEVAEKQKSALYMGKSLADSVTEGVVVLNERTAIAKETGEAIYNVNDPQEGDIVHWEKYAEAEGLVKIDGKEYYPIKKDQIIFMRRESEKK